MKPQKSSQRQLLGKYGEHLAASYLQKHGYQIIDRNFRVRYGELDIIALDGSTTVFVEVKTRRNESYGSPEESVTPRKLHEVVKTTQYYMQTHRITGAVRIDVIGILLDSSNTIRRFKHLKCVTL